MKVIDLLNKIANGEEVPKKIKYKNAIFTIRDDKDDYTSESTWFTDCYDYLELNDEVEVIEEDKKIEHIENYVDFANLNDDEKFDYLYEMETRIMDKINKEK